MIDAMLYILMSYKPPLLQVTQAMISQLVGKIRDDMPGLEASEATNQIVQHFNSTLAYIKSKHGMSFPTS